MTAPAQTPEPPYYAVVFSNQHRATDLAGYDATAARMVDLARRQPGFLGVESARSPDGFGITVSYWDSEAAIAAWKAQGEHLDAQQRGRTDWYQRYVIRVAKVERDYHVDC